MTDIVELTGNAIAAPETPVSIVEQAVEIITTGGPVIVILAGFSVVALALTLVKLWQFQVVRLGDTRSARQAVRLFRADRIRDSLEVAGRSPNPVSQAVERAIRGLHQGLPEMTVREEVLRFGGEAVEDLRACLRPLEIIAALAPLLGLLGTVMGMIEAFKQMEAAGAQVDPSVLSGGIWEALLTTAVGLAVAIPVVAVHAWLDRCVERVAHDMDSIVTQVFTVDLSGGPVGAAVHSNPNLTASYATGS